MTAGRGILSEDVVVGLACVALAGLGLAGLHYGNPRAAGLFWGAGAAAAAWAWWPRAGARTRRLRRALRRELASRGYVESADAAALLTREMSASVLARSPWHFRVDRAWTMKLPFAEIAWGFYVGWVDESPLRGVFATALFERPFERAAKLAPLEGAPPGGAAPERYQAEVEGADARAWLGGLPHTLSRALAAAEGFTFAMEGRRLVADWEGRGVELGGTGVGRRASVVEAFEEVVAELARHALAPAG